MLLTSTPHCLDQIHVWSFSVLFMGISGTDHSTQWHGTLSSGDDCQCFTLINHLCDRVQYSNLWWPVVAL